jgi:hypothetical protein
MRTEQVRIYKFDELPEGAKDSARAWFREGNDYVWWDDSLKSIKEFCNEYGVTIKDYQVGLCSYSYMETNAENAHFRGRKLSEVKQDYMPTGYCLDCNLWETFRTVWKETGSPLRAFNDAIDQAIKDIVSDMEYQDSDEAIDEMLIANEYEFDEDGRFY